MSVIRKLRRIWNAQKELISVPVIFIASWIISKVAEDAQEAVWSRFLAHKFVIPAIWVLAAVLSAAAVFSYVVRLALRLGRSNVGRLSTEQRAVADFLASGGQRLSDLDHKQSAIVVWDLEPQGFVYQEEGIYYVRPEYQWFLGKKG